MGNSQKNEIIIKIRRPRKIYIDLLSDEEPIIQPEIFCGNDIKTTHYNLYINIYI